MLLQRYRNLQSYRDKAVQSSFGPLDILTKRWSLPAMLMRKTEDRNLQQKFITRREIRRTRMPLARLAELNLSSRD